MSLYVLTYVFARDIDLFNVTHLQVEMEAWAAHRGIRPADMPHFCIVAEHLPEDDMADFFNSADAFVLPTRGEGWGLPTIQSMALGKPTISTGWGGRTFKALKRVH